MSDTLVNRRAYRTFNVIDDCARDVLAIEIDFSLTGERVVRVLQQLCEWHGKPDAMRAVGAANSVGDWSPTKRCSFLGRPRVALTWPSARTRAIVSSPVPPDSHAQQVCASRTTGTLSAVVGVDDTAVIRF